MTGLGASIYLGFFALAALWLFLTSDGPVMGEPTIRTSARIARTRPAHRRSLTGQARCW